MKWTVLVDNRTEDPSLETEHGLSVLLETDSHRILLDTGANDLLIRNAEKLGADLTNVDYVFISHGHNDHAGGLCYFMEINTTAQIVVSPDAIAGRFFSSRGGLHGITTAWPAIPATRLRMVEKSGLIADDIYVMARIPQAHPMPKGNGNLYAETAGGDLVHDVFRHELALYIDGLLFTGCAHSGLENILAACPYPVNEVVGGFHLLDGYESVSELTALANRLSHDYPQTQFHTSHCTGDGAYATLKSIMGPHMHAFSCGTTNHRS